VKPVPRHNRNRAYRPQVTSAPRQSMAATPSADGALVVAKPNNGHYYQALAPGLSNAAPQHNPYRPPSISFLRVATSQ
jgi:hypothetical protein